MVEIIIKTMEKKLSKTIFFATVLFIASLCCYSCTERNVIYNESHSFVNSEWSIYDKADFTVNVSDTSNFYRIGILVRNEGNYQYQNLWLFVDCLTPDSIIHTDTVQYLLCDDFGKWIGKSSIGSLYTTTYLYQDSVKFNKRGSYTYSITHAMRHDLLYGIADVGVKVVSLSE